MSWTGNKIKQISKEKNLTITELAGQIGVSRQAVNDWINGNPPKGIHLIKLCQILGVSPDVFFNITNDTSIQMPVHRRRGTAKVNKNMNDYALELAKEYQLLFKNVKETYLSPQLKVPDNSYQSALAIAGKFRSLAEVPENLPLDYPHVFKLLERLEIYVIFREFIDGIKSYAFYTKIHGHSVVFVNTKTNVLDLIFPLIHEAVHAVRDINDNNGEYDDAEESFCDQVANLVQFPPAYVNKTYKIIKDRHEGSQINLLKVYCRENHHSLYGVYSSMKDKLNIADRSAAAADTNLKKEFKSIGEIIFDSSRSERELVSKLKRFSSKFTALLTSNAADFSDRKIAELINLESSLDGRLIKQELLESVYEQVS